MYLETRTNIFFSFYARLEAEVSRGKIRSLEWSSGVVQVKTSNWSCRFIQFLNIAPSHPRGKLRRIKKQEIHRIQHSSIYILLTFHVTAGASPLLKSSSASSLIFWLGSETQRCNHTTASIPTAPAIPTRISITLCAYSRVADLRISMARTRSIAGSPEPEYGVSGKKQCVVRAAATGVLTVLLGRWQV